MQIWKMKGWIYLHTPSTVPDHSKKPVQATYNFELFFELDLAVFFITELTKPTSCVGQNKNLIKFRSCALLLETCLIIIYRYRNDHSLQAHNMSIGLITGYRLKFWGFCFSKISKSKPMNINCCMPIVGFESWTSLLPIHQVMVSH